MLKVTLAKVLTVKIAAIAVATLAVGGVAVAAATGNLPNQGDPTPPPAVTVPSLPDKPSGDSGAGQGSNAPDKDKNTGPDKPNGDNASPSPSLAGLCNAFTAGAGADHGKALENPAFTALITAAGGKDKVPAYCADLAGKPGKSGNPPGKPNTPANGNGSDKGHPDSNPDSNPNGNSNGNPGNGDPNGSPPSARPNR